MTLSSLTLKRNYAIRWIRLKTLGSPYAFDSHVMIGTDLSGEIPEECQTVYGNRVVDNDTIIPSRHKVSISNNAMGEPVGSHKRSRTIRLP